RHAGAAPSAPRRGPAVRPRARRRRAHVDYLRMAGARLQARRIPPRPRLRGRAGDRRVPRRHRRDHVLHRRRPRRLHRSPSELLMSTPENPQTTDTPAEAAPGSGAPALAVDDRAEKSWFSRLPIISHLRQSVGLQRGMLITGLVLCAIVLICAIFAPLIAPYGFNQLGTSEGNFGSKLPPGGTHIWGTTVGGYDVFSRVVWGAQTAVAVIVVAVVMSIFAGV